MLSSCRDSRWWRNTTCVCRHLLLNTAQGWSQREKREREKKKIKKCGRIRYPSNVVYRLPLKSLTTEYGRIKKKTAAGRESLFIDYKIGRSIQNIKKKKPGQAPFLFVFKKKIINKQSIGIGCAWSLGNRAKQKWPLLQRTKKKNYIHVGMKNHQVEYAFRVPVFLLIEVVTCDDRSNFQFKFNIKSIPIRAYQTMSTCLHVA